MRWLLLSALAAGCATTYRTPGEAADLSHFLEREVRDAWRRKPAAKFPAHVATVRVQGPGYASRTARGWGSGGYTVLTHRDVETREDFARLRGLPDVAQIAPLSHLLLSPRLQSDAQLRQAAAALHADLVLVYTLDTHFHVDKRLRPATVVSLGLFPNRRAHVQTTASAVLLDTRTGFVHGTATATGREDKLANAWSSEQAVDDARRKAERAAFVALVDELADAWPASAPGRYRTE